MLDLPLTVRAQWVLALEGLVLLGAVLGIYAIRRRPRPRRQWHCWGLTVLVVAQTLLFLGGMARSFWLWWPSFRQRDTVIMLLHALVGGASLILGWWAVLVLQLKAPLPGRRTVRQLRPVMRSTAVIWTIGLALGVALYAVLYVFF